MNLETPPPRAGLASAVGSSLLGTFKGGFIGGISTGYIWIMEKNMETAVWGLGF